MVIALAGAGLLGLGTTARAYNNMPHRFSKIERGLAAIAAGSVVIAILLGIALLAVKLNKAIWKDHHYSPQAWETLKKAANISGITFGAAVALGILLLLFRCCKERYAPAYVQVGQPLLER